MTGVPNARQASASPSTASRSLPEIFRLVGIAEVEVIGHGQRNRAGAGEIARRFRDRDPPAFARIERAVERIAIGRGGEKLVRLAEMENRGVGSRPNDRSGADHVIVLAIDPVLRGDRRIARELRKQLELWIDSRMLLQEI